MYGTASDVARGVSRLLMQEGFSPILMPGFAWATALGKIADDRERPGRAAPHQHAPIHLRQFLRLVDHDVPIGPIPIRCGTFGEFAGVMLQETVGEVARDQQVLGDQMVLVVHHVLASDHHVQPGGGCGDAEKSPGSSGCRK